MSKDTLTGKQRVRAHHARQVAAGLARFTAYVPAAKVATFRALAEAEKAAHVADEPSPLDGQAAGVVPLAVGLRQALAELDDWLAWAEASNNVTKAEATRQRRLVDRLRTLACDAERAGAESAS